MQDSKHIVMVNVGIVVVIILHLGSRIGIVVVVPAIVHPVVEFRSMLGCGKSGCGIAHMGGLTRHGIRGPDCGPASLALFRR
jgi:hypothetical protein